LTVQIKETPIEQGLTSVSDTTVIVHSYRNYHLAL